MPLSVLMISVDSPSAQPAIKALSQCGIHVVTPEMPSAADGSIYRHAACAIIDMPGASGLRTLQMMRRHDVDMPAVLIADPGLAIPHDDLEQARVVGLLQRPASTKALLLWMETFCIFRLLAETALPDNPARAA